ncbi:MAG: Ku protein [Methanomicrobiaceae archaeon]|nr:Ku protein [Methanomicrobiaceae archaeon]
MEEENDQSGSEEKEISLLRPVWTGSISLGLVNVPVKALPITRDRTIHFRMIHRECGTPIHYKKVCEEGKEVDRDGIVYGYEFTRGEYVILEKEELEEAKPESSNDISLDAFISYLEVDPHYFRKTYLLVPDESDRAYALLLQAMIENGRAAVGTVTMHSRERIMLIHPYEEGIVATELRYEDEILSPAKAPSLSDLPEPAKEELELAQEIIERLTKPFDHSGYTDRYREQLIEIITAKAEGRIVELGKKEKKPSVENLLVALRQTAEGLKEDLSG